MPRIVSPFAAHVNVDMFVRMFRDEAQLRQAIADLLVRMRREQVTITHSATEKGKDVIFCAQGGFGERRLFACVIKSHKITGQVGSSNGAPAVIAQIEQCFDIPYIDQSGARQMINTVYVISPFNISEQALEAVAGKLQRLGQIEFLCGSKLLDCFKEHYADFLVEHGGLLDHYLNALYKTLSTANALAELFRRNPLLGHLPQSIVSFYVTPQCEYRIGRFVMRNNVTKLLSEERDLETHIVELTTAAEILDTVVHFHDANVVKTHYLTTIAALRALIKRLREREHVTKKERPRDEEEEEREKRQLRLEALASSEHDRVTLQEARKLLSSTARLCNELVEQADQLRAQDLASPLGRALVDPSLLIHNRTDCLARSVPGLMEPGSMEDVIIADANELHTMESPVLLTGPPGSGKTTFCRWSCWLDIIAFKEKPDSPIPVYIPLHTLSIRSEDFREVLFADLALREVLGLASESSRSTRPVRLYLDGLDEMASEDQRKVIALAEKAAGSISKLQIFLTSRDHVSGGYLCRFPRVRIREADEARILSLASEFYADDTDTLDEFRRQLDCLPALAEVIRVPLLTVLAMAYFRNSRSLPSSRLELYDVFTSLLSGGWDLAKNIRRSCRFGEQLKRDVLTRFAYNLHKKRRREGDAKEFRIAVGRSVTSYEDVSDALLDEIVADGSLVRAGRSFSFPHLSFQEYFASRALRAPDGSSADETLSEYLSGDDWWAEVLAFYLLGVSDPFRLDWWILNRRKGHSAEQLQKQGERLLRAYKERFPDREPEWVIY